MLLTGLPLPDPNKQMACLQRCRRCGRIDAEPFQHSYASSSVSSTIMSLTRCPALLSGTATPTGGCRWQCSGWSTSTACSRSGSRCQIWRPAHGSSGGIGPTPTGRCRGGLRCAAALGQQQIVPRMMAHAALCRGIQGRRLGVQSRLPRFEMRSACLCLTRGVPRMNKTLRPGDGHGSSGLIRLCGWYGR